MSDMKLSESHSLVKYTFNMFGDRVTRSDLSGETVTAHGIKDAKAVKTTIDAMGSEEFIELKNLRQSSRNEFNALSFPWDTYRITPNINVDKLEKIASNAQIKAEQIVQRIIEKLPAWIELQRQVMGTAFREEDYMTADVIKEKVRVGYDIRTVPDPEHDPRAGVSDLSRERFSAKIRKEEARKVAQAAVVMQSELAKLVGKMKESLEGYDGTRVGAYRDSLFTNLSDYAAKIPDFNLGNNREIEQVRKQILQELASLNPDTTRVDEQVRKDAAKKAGNILDKINAFGSSPAIGQHD